MNAGYEWTGDDAAFAGRVDAALSGLDIPAADLDEWRECCRRWGPRSRSALGCLLGFVQVAWGPHRRGLAVVTFDGEGVFVEIISVDGDDGCTYSPLTEGLPDEPTALLAALEAATR